MPDSPRNSGIIVGIHQPNFFPWLGYFAKISRSDVFIFLDDAQLPKKGGSWINRVMIAADGRAQWLTAGVDRRVSGVQSIGATRFAATDWRQKSVRILENSYKKAEYFDEGMQLIGPLLGNRQDRLASYNIHAITSIAKALSIPAGRFRLASSLDSSGSATERLISLVQTVGGSTYLAGDGAAGYQRDDLFERSRIGLERLNFAEPVREQVGAPNGFLPGLSIIDSIMNLGVEATAQLVRDPVRLSATEAESA